MQPAQVESDVNFVRQVLARSETHRSPASIYLLWAAIILVGFPIVDLAPRYAGLFWMIAGPLGGLLSFFLGYRASRNAGVIRKTEGLRYTLHWLGLMGAILLLVLYFAMGRGTLTYDAFGQIILLLLALTYFLAGVHLDRPMLWSGLLMAAGFVTLVFVAKWTWTITGVVVAVAMVLSALSSTTGGRRNAALEG